MKTIFENILCVSRQKCTSIVLNILYLYHISLYAVIYRSQECHILFFRLEWPMTLASVGIKLQIINVDMQQGAVLVYMLHRQFEKFDFNCKIQQVTVMFEI